MIYHVKFFYGDDLRVEAQVVAKDEVEALVFAMHEKQISCWVDSPHLCIEISMEDKGSGSIPPFP